MQFTIMDARRVQSDLSLGEVHVVYYDPGDGFVMAHTDAERASHMDLTTCRYHYWLCKAQDPDWTDYLWDFPEAGWYRLNSYTEAKGLAL